MITRTLFPRLSATFFTALVFAVALAACGSSDNAEADAAEGDSLKYTLGEPLTDSTLTAIVVSEYGSDTLTTEQFRTQFEMIAAQVPQVRTDADQARELRKNIVEDFIITHAIKGEAENLGISIDSAAVSERLNQIKTRFPNEESFQQALAADNLTEGELRTNIGDMMRQEQMLQRMSEGVKDPTEAETQEYRESQAKQIRASHILFLVPQGADAAREAEIRKEAQAVLDSVEAGSDFAEMARRHSADGSAQMGGDLGFFSRGQMVKPFEDAAYALADSGDVTDELVKTQFGYHIIQLTGRQTAALMDTTQARQMLTQTRRREAVQDAVDELRGKVTVRLNPAIVDADLNAE